MAHTNFLSGERTGAVFPGELTSFAGGAVEAFFGPKTSNLMQFEYVDGYTSSEPADHEQSLKP